MRDEKSFIICIKQRTIFSVKQVFLFLLYQACVGCQKWQVNRLIAEAQCGGRPCPLPLSRYDLIIKGHGGVIIISLALLGEGGSTS